MNAATGGRRYQTLGDVALGPNGAARCIDYRKVSPARQQIEPLRASLLRRGDGRDDNLEKQEGRMLLNNQADNLHLPAVRASVMFGSWRLNGGRKMRRIIMTLTAALVGLAAGCTGEASKEQGATRAQRQSASATAQRAPHDGRLMRPEKITERVWYKRQPPRIWSAVIGNVGIVEQSDGVVLIDSGGSIADGRDIVKEVAALTSRPIKAVVITHWHNDHPLGAPGILESYSDARIIATTTTADLMRNVMGRNVGVGNNNPALDKARLDSAETYIRELQASSKDPQLTVAERREFATEAAWVSQRVKRQMGNFVALPTETFTDRLLLTIHLLLSNFAFSAPRTRPAIW